MIHTAKLSTMMSWRRAPSGEAAEGDGETRRGSSVSTSQSPMLLRRWQIRVFSGISTHLRMRSVRLSHKCVWRYILSIAERLVNWAPYVT